MSHSFCRSALVLIQNLTSKQDLAGPQELEVEIPEPQLRNALSQLAEVLSKMMGRRVTQEEGNKRVGMPTPLEVKELKLKALLYEFHSFIKGQRWLMYIGCSI